MNSSSSPHAAQGQIWPCIGACFLSENAVRGGLRGARARPCGVRCGPSRLRAANHCPYPARKPPHKHKGAGGRATSQLPSHGLLAAHEKGGCAGTSRRAWTCNCATPRAHELHTDVLDHLATPEVDGMARGREPDSAAEGVMRREARPWDWAREQRNGRQTPHQGESGANKHRGQ